MQTLSTDARNLNWLVSSFVSRVAAVTEAVVVSSDGLLIAMSDSLDRAVGDRLAAVAAGLMSIARGAGQPVHAGAVSQIIIEMEHALLIVMRYVDLYWYIIPNFQNPTYPGMPFGFHISWLYIAAPVAIGGFWLWFFFARLAERPVLPIHDPILRRLVE